MELQDDGYRDCKYWEAYGSGLENSIYELETMENYTKAKIEAVEKSIKKYPNYYDFYIELHSQHVETTGTSEMLELGYKYAIQRLKDENDGKLPELVNWLFLENRHIFRIIYNHAENLRNMKKYKESNKVLNVLIRLNRSDYRGGYLKKLNNIDRSE